MVQTILVDNVLMVYKVIGLLVLFFLLIYSLLLSERSERSSQHRRC